MGEIKGTVRRMPRPPLAPFSGTRTFYSAATAGGTVNVLNTVTIENGFVKSWTQAVAGAGGALWFDDADHSAHIITSGIA